MATRKRLRGNGEGSVYPVKRKRRRNGKDVEVTIYEGFVTLDIVGVKQRRKYVTAPTKAECTAKIRALLNQRDEGTLTLTASPTIQEWLEYYLSELAPRKPIAGRTGNRNSTLATYKGYARNHVHPRIGKVKLERLTVEHLESVYQAMADQGMATASIKQCHAMLRTALKVAWQRGRLARNLAALVMLPAGVAAAEVREVTVQEMQAVLERARARRMSARWVVRLGYGLRQGEALGLTWDDVDFDAEILHIRQQLQRDRAEHGCGRSVGVQKYTSGNGEARERLLYPCGKAQPARCPSARGGGLVLVPVKTKTSKAPLPLPRPVAELLKARRQEQRRERIQEGSRWRGWEADGKRVELVFTQPNGRPIDPRDDWDEWYELLGEASVEGIKPHAARHWAATMLVALGVHPRVAMEMLRHADVSTTLNLYARAPSADLRAAADALAEALLGKAVSE